MKKIAIVSIVVGMIASGCATEKRCARRFPLVTIIERHDSTIYRDSIVYRDTTVEVPLPADTVTIVERVYVSNGVASMPKVVKQNGIITAEAEVKNGMLLLSSFLNDSLLFVTLRNAIKERNSYKELYQNYSKQESKPIVTNVLHWWQKTLMYIGLIALILTAIIVYRKIKRVISNQKS